MLRPLRNTKRWKVLPPSGFYMDCNYKGGLKNASSLAVATFEIATAPFHSSRITYYTSRNLLIQSSESVGGFCYQRATFLSCSRKPVAAVGLPHSHLGPRWWASGRPPSLLPSSGCHWWRPPWGPPGGRHWGSRPRRPPGCPGLWTWCRRRWNPGLWCAAACWLGWTARTAAPRGAACPTRCRCGGLTHVPSTRPWHAGGYLILEERGGCSGGKEGATMWNEGKKQKGRRGGGQRKLNPEQIERSHKQDRKEGVMKAKHRKEKQTGHSLEHSSLHLC